MLLKFLGKTFRRKRPQSELREAALAAHARGELGLAERHFRELALQNPSDLSSWTNLAATLVKQSKFQEAIPVLFEIIELQPDFAEAHLDLGVCCGRLRKNVEAIGHFLKAIELKPGLAKAHANLINAYMDCCDWSGVEQWVNGFLHYRSEHPVRDWAQRIEPFTALSVFPGEITRELAIERAALIAASVAGNGNPVSPRPRRERKGGRIRVGYVSADFYSHATAHLTFSLYERHDRREFEIYAYSFGPDDGSAYRKHIEATCDRFFDVREELAAATAERIRSDAIDILIDMKGYTANARPQIFARRPAPVQVGYLGYPATSGAPFIDYFITDRVATPRGCESEFTESLVFMPHCYQANDDRQPVASAALSRADCGLPAEGIVFCSFNTLRKIDPRIFTIWMDVLRRVQGSVLWLIREDPDGEANLRKEAAARGIDPGRLIFAEKTDKPAHLARHRLADLFLDTYICNAHTTASDALWAGLPLLTCPGETFARRVAASLLTAAGVPELIAPDLDQYRDRAVQLALDPGLLGGLRDRLSRNRSSCALFDTSRYVRDLETAYRKMLEIDQRSTSPFSFDVDAERSVRAP